MRILAIALALVGSSCAAHAQQPAQVHLDGRGWLEIRCPGTPDACADAAARHCSSGYLVSGGTADSPEMLVRPQAGRPYALHAARYGSLHVMCIARVMEEEQAH